MKTEKKESREKIGNALLKVALGCRVEEVTEEYAEVDGALKLTKRRRTKKDIPPDLKAVQLLLGETERACSELSDEELEEEKNRLLGLLGKENEEAGGKARFSRKGKEERATNGGEEVEACERERTEEVGEQREACETVGGEQSGEKGPEQEEFVGKKSSESEARRSGSVSSSSGEPKKAAKKRKTASEKSNGAEDGISAKKSASAPKRRAAKRRSVRKKTGETQ